ncbi:MAG: methyltransferase domain-containing protein [Pyrinomonadaceae bacterium]
MSETSSHIYFKQHRGDASAYENYFAGMDASMQQKIALTTAHFPTRGLIADMGSGSGRGTFDLARLYHHLELVGVDINQVAVEQSAKKYQAPNLKFTVGDIADRVFPENSLDGILNSSVLHHVTSFNDYDIRQITRTLLNQVAQLKTGGTLIVRDFVVPDGGEEMIFLDLPFDDGEAAGEIANLSSAALFEVFARDFRSSVNRNHHVQYLKHSSPHPGFIRFETKLRAAAEFVLRKDYRRDWDAELIEEYTYFSQTEFEQAFRSNGLRTTVSAPLWNPWIVNNRFVGKFFVSNKAGASLPFPPTNFLIVGEKLLPGEGYEITESAASESASPGFLKLNYYRHTQTGQILELAMRPNQTIDVLPWFDRDGQIFVLAKKDFPRPLLNACRDQPNLHRANYSGYLTEPISAILDGSHRIADLPDKVKSILESRAGLPSEDVLEISEPQLYYTSPGGIDEAVQSFLIRIAGWDKEPQKIENYTKFANAGTVRELDALQVLRASHVGGMFDARLEINVYRLLRELRKSTGAWIGAQITAKAQTAPEKFLELKIPSPGENVQAFEAVESGEPQFLELRRGEFVESDARGETLARAEFEYVVPRRLSRNTAAAIPFFQADGKIFVGLEFRDLPAPQNFTDNSRLICVPAWRLPFSVKDTFRLETLLLDFFKKDFCASPIKCWELGGSYFPTPGVTPEIVYPFAVEIETGDLAQCDLQFVEIGSLMEKLDQVQDAHLLILANRLFHALCFSSNDVPG